MINILRLKLGSEKDTPVNDGLVGEIVVRQTTLWFYVWLFRMRKL